MVRRIISILFTVWISITILSGQQILAIANAAFADSLFSNGKYEIAKIEYLRCQFFGVNNQANDIDLKLSTIYEGEKNYSKSLQYIDKYFFKQMDNLPLHDEILLSRAKINLKAEQYYDAIADLSQISSYSLDKNRVVYYLFITNILADQYQDAEKYLDKLDYLTPYDKNSIKKVIQKLLKNNNKNYGRYKWLNIFLPGIGQAINGDVKDGIISFLVVGSMVYLFVDISMSLSIADGTVSVGPWFMRYFMGGLSNAEKLGISKKQKQKLKLVSELNSALLSFKKGT
jgi:tetratricopeptide (TPR) repeat protein